MSLVRTLRTLASQRPSLPSSSVAEASRVHRRRHSHVPVTWIDPELAPAATVVHLHGGAYLHGETPQTWSWLEEVSRRSGAAGAMIHHRLAPRHRFPTAVEDVLHALDAMGEELHLRPGRWVLSGEGSGGGLALAVAQVLAASPADAPAAVLLDSPWVDLSREDHDEEELRLGARLYAGGMPRTDPRLSPLFGELSSLPPVHLVSGGRGPLADDSRRLAAALAEAGAEHEHLELPGAGDAVAIDGRGPGSQQARRFQIAAVRHAVGLEGTVGLTH